MQFFKYHSLKNDFIIFDFLYTKKSSFNFLKTPEWKKNVVAWCDRKIGIGADGVLLITRSTQGSPEIFIFNSDGSNGQMCINGLRCVAQHLFKTCGFSNSFTLLMAQKTIQCTVTQSGVQLTVPQATFIKKHTFVIEKNVKIGFQLDAGNPHLIIVDPSQNNSVAYDKIKVTEYLLKVVSFIQQKQHNALDANISLAWPINRNTYHLITYERGCGITQSCSSAATALTTVLALQNKLAPDRAITIHMLGGTLQSHVNSDGNVVLQAFARKIFSGTVPLSLSIFKSKSPSQTDQIFNVG